AASDHRLAVGGAPHRGRRHAPGHRPARLRPAGPAERVPQGGIPALRGAVRFHPPPGGEHHLPGPGRAAAAGTLGRLPDGGARPASPRRRAGRGGRRRGGRDEWRRRRRDARRRPDARGTRRLGHGGHGRDRGAGGRAAGPPRLHAVGCQDRAERRLLVRIGAQVQEVSRPLRRSGTRTLLQVVAVALAGFLLLLFYAIYRIAAQGDIDEARRADAIVVLGAAQFNGQPGGVFEARLQHAVDLWKEGLAPYLIVTGGKLPDDRTTEAATARAWAIANGVPEEAILGE